MARTKQAPKGLKLSKAPYVKQILALKKAEENLKSFSGGIKEPNRSKNVLSDIRKYQRSTNLLIPKLSFQRLVKDITSTLCKDKFIKFQPSALLALQVYCMTRVMYTEMKKKRAFLKSAMFSRRVYIRKRYLTFSEY